MRRKNSVIQYALMASSQTAVYYHPVVQGQVSHMEYYDGLRGVVDSYVQAPSRESCAVTELSAT